MDIILAQRARVQEHLQSANHGFGWRNFPHPGFIEMSCNASAPHAPHSLVGRPSPYYNRNLPRCQAKYSPSCPHGASTVWSHGAVTVWTIQGLHFPHWDAILTLWGFYHNYYSYGSSWGCCQAVPPWAPMWVHSGKAFQDTHHSSSRTTPQTMWFVEIGCIQPHKYGRKQSESCGWTVALWCSRMDFTVKL